MCQSGVGTNVACGKPARCAIRTTRSRDRTRMQTTIHYDERTAPKNAVPYCKEHGVQTMKELAEVLIDNG